MTTKNYLIDYDECENVAKVQQELNEQFANITIEQLRAAFTAYAGWSYLPTEKDDLIDACDKDAVEKTLDLIETYKSLYEAVQWCRSVSTIILMILDYGDEEVLACILNRALEVKVEQL